ncbi:hypothetical protein BG844_27050 [Couchioplanes caeruleus subsp. caeruleus]|uniref:Uncharacterized protein n=1 Tax=Couchioplanes caeruleus subsp. caeruleus TaxID=56427 RepID=A0A1K0GGJ6_9ACTN|nr:hypothetical protein [Couchioplanes caeruleus]OJF11310.1 hypothetical protein BG844_27050 [Couchioplanes caeruleus subsp. caeruleus]
MTDNRTWQAVARATASHGTTLGALSITGVPALKQPYEPLMPSTSAATAVSSASNSSRTRPAPAAAPSTKATRATFEAAESERLLRGFLSRALFDAGPYRRADDPRRPGRAARAPADL